MKWFKREMVEFQRCWQRMESQQRVKRAVENRKREESCGSGKEVVEGREDTWQEGKPVSKVKSMVGLPSEGFRQGFRRLELQ